MPGIEIFSTDAGALCFAPITEFVIIGAQVRYGYHHYIRRARDYDYHALPVMN